MSLGPCTAALLAVAAAGAAAGAQEAALVQAEPVLVAENRAAPSPHLQVQASAVPRLDGQDAGFQSPRVDVSLFPSGRHGMAAVLGMSGMGAQQPALSQGLTSPRTAEVDVGLRFSHEFRNSHQIDVMAWRRMNEPDDAFTNIQMREQPVYGARVEMKIKPAKFGGLGMDRGLLGFQLESGARISFKRKDGRPMVYYRTSF